MCAVLSLVWIAEIKRHIFHEMLSDFIWTGARLPGVGRYNVFHEFACVVFELMRPWVTFRICYDEI